MSRKSADSRAGFTLLEVLVAFAVLALVLAAAFQLLGSGLGGSERAGRYTHALLAAQSKLAEIGVSDRLRPGRMGGVLDGGYRWRAEVRRLLPGAAAEPEAERRLPVDAYEVTVTVSWGAEAVTLDTLRLATRDGDG
ncbi:MAG: prepilin-type N-terminal cleavage/methylation domain-containing protein [Kiloniellales bacterium]